MFTRKALATVLNVSYTSGRQPLLYSSYCTANLSLLYFVLYCTVFSKHLYFVLIFSHLDFVLLFSCFRGDFAEGRLRYSNSEVTETVDETLMAILDRGDTSVTLIGMLLTFLSQFSSLSNN